MNDDQRRVKHGPSEVVFGCKNTLLKFDCDGAESTVQPMPLSYKLDWLNRLESMERVLAENPDPEYDEARRQFREYEPMLARLRKQLRPETTPADGQANGAP